MQYGRKNTRIKRTEIIIDQVPAITNIHLNNLNVTEYYRIEIKLFLHITKLSLAVTFDIQRLLLDRSIFLIWNMSSYYQYLHEYLPYKILHLSLTMLILKPWHFKSYIQILQKDIICGFSLSVYMLNRQIYIRNEFEVFKWKTQVVQIWCLR